jgi:hypothetical protein
MHIAYKKYIVENGDIIALIVNNPCNVLCFNLWERAVSKIRERVCEEGILHLYIYHIFI